MANIITGLVLPQIGNVDPAAVQQRAVVALDATVEALQNAPLKTLQDALWGGGSVRTGVRSRCRLHYLLPICDR